VHTRTNAIEDQQKESETTLSERKFENGTQNGELRFYGSQGMVMNPLAMCDKLDKMFGSGAEAIVHYMLLESGRETFDKMMKNNQNKSRGQLLKALVDLQPSHGWGYLSLTIVHTDPPKIELTVRNPPIKTQKGSQKHLISSFWAGVLSVYFNRQLLSKNLCYRAERDEFGCTIST